MSNRIDGPVVVDPPPEKSEDKIGNTSMNKRGSSPIRVVWREAGGSAGALGSRGLRRGLVPPN